MPTTYIRLNDFNIKDFVSIILNDPDIDSAFTKNLAKACYQEGVSIAEFIPLFEMNDILDIHSIQPFYNILNPSVLFDNQELYLHLASTQTREFFSLPPFTFVQTPNQYERIYTITETELSYRALNYTAATVVDNTNTKNMRRIVFKLEPYAGKLEKLKDMFQVTYAYACDEMYNELQTLKNQGIDEINIQHVCNPYLVQYYENYKNTGWEFNRNSYNANSNSYNKKHCHVDHTLLIDKHLADNLLAHANLNMHQTPNWTGVIDGEIEDHRHKTAHVSINRNLVGYQNAGGRNYTCGNKRLNIRDNARLHYPLVNFDEEKHIKFIRLCIQQEDEYRKNHRSVDHLKKQFGFVFTSILDKQTV